jgi:hypothetical protein
MDIKHLYIVALLHAIMAYAWLVFIGLNLIQITDHIMSDIIMQLDEIGTLYVADDYHVGVVNNIRYIIPMGTIMMYIGHAYINYVGFITSLHLAPDGRIVIGIVFGNSERLLADAK